MGLTTRLIGLTAGILAVWYIAHLQGRIDELERQVAAAATTVGAPAAAPAAVPASAAATEPRAISAAQRTAMVEALSANFTNAGSPVWFATVANNPEAAEYQKILQSVFEEAGWKVQSNGTVGFAMKPGIYIFAADDEPPSFVDAVYRAFEVAGIELAGSGRGYREYFKERRAENPKWTGFEMAAEQSFLIAIGRKPEAPPAAP